MAFPRMRRPVARSVLQEGSVQFHTHSTPVVHCPVVTETTSDGGRRRVPHINPLYQIYWSEVDRRFNEAVLHAIDTGATHVDLIIAVRNANTQPTNTGRSRPEGRPRVRRIQPREDTNAEH